MDAGRAPSVADAELAVDRVTSAADPRLADFLHLRDVQLRTRREAAEGIFVAEGERTIRRAAAAGYALRSVLLTERWLPDLHDLLLERRPRVLVVDDELLAATIGFPVHRGALASLERRPVAPAEQVLASAARVVVLEDLTDHTNLGAIFRSAAAFGFDAVALTPRCADPLYRRAIRTSMGAVFAVPWTRIGWRDGPDLLRRIGFELIALTPDPGADPLAALEPDRIPRLAIALGTEGTGLSTTWLEAAARRVRIPIEPGVDSLNVAAAAAVACYHLRGRP